MSVRESAITMEADCPEAKCGTAMLVHILEMDGLNEPEEFSCPRCGRVAGSVKAGLPPRTTIDFDNDKAGKS